MSANPPLSLVSIDPGLAFVGLAAVTVTGHGQFTVDRVETFATTPKGELLARLDDLTCAVRDVIRSVSPEYCVIEDPTAQIQSDQKGRRKDPRNLYKLCTAFGAIVHTCLVEAGRISLVPVGQWYPKDGRHNLAKPLALAAIRRQYPELGKVSEHIAFALGLAEYWSRTRAIEIWFERRRTAAMSA